MGRHTFETGRYPALIVAGVGRFTNGRLEVDDAGARVLRALADDGRYGIRETTPPPAPRKRTTPKKPSSSDGG